MTDSEPSGLGTATLSMGGGSLPPIALPPLSLPPLKTTESHIGLSPMGGLSYPSPNINQSLMGSPLMPCGSSPMNVVSSGTINSPMMYRPPQSPQNQANQYGGPGSAGSHIDGFVTSPGPPKTTAQRKSRPRPRTVNRQLMDSIQTSPNSNSNVNVNCRQIKSVPVSPSSSNPPTPSSVPMMRYNSIDGGMNSPLGGSPNASIMHSPVSHQHTMVLNGQSPCQSPKPNGFHTGPNQGPPTTNTSIGGQSVAHVSVHHVQSMSERPYNNEMQSSQSNRNASFLSQQLSKPAARPPRPAQQSVLIEHKNLPPREDHFMASNCRNGGPPGQQMQQSVSHVTVIPSSGHQISACQQERSTVSSGGRLRMQQHAEHAPQQSSQAIVQHLPLRVGSAVPASTSSTSFQVRNAPYPPQQQTGSHAVIQHQQLPPITQMNNSTLSIRAPNQQQQQGSTAVQMQDSAMSNNSQQYHSQSGTSQDYSSSMHNMQDSRPSQAQQAQTAMYPVATVTSHPVSRIATSRPRPPNQNTSDYANATITVSMQSSSVQSKNNRSRPPGQFTEDEILTGSPKQEGPPAREMKREPEHQMPSDRNPVGSLRMGQSQFYGEAAVSKTQTTMNTNAAMTTAVRTTVRPKIMSGMNVSQTNGPPIEVMQQVAQRQTINRNQKVMSSNQSGQPALSQEQIKRILAQRRPVGPVANLNGQNGLSTNGQLCGAQIQAGPPRLVHRIGSQGPPEQRISTIPPQSHLRNMLGGTGSTNPSGQRIQTTQIVPGMGPPVLQRPPAQIVTPQVLQLAQSIDNQRQLNVQSNKDQFRSYKRKFKCLVYENECYQEELRNLQRKLLKLSRDKNFLLDRLMNYEKFSDSSDYESDASQQTVTDRPKTRKRVRASQSQRKRSTVSPSGSRVDESISGTPSPCPSPSPAMHSHYQQAGPSGMNRPQENKFAKSSSVKNRRSSMPNQTQYALLEDIAGSSCGTRNSISQIQQNTYGTTNYNEESNRMERKPNGLQTNYGGHYAGAQNSQEVSDSLVNGACSQSSRKKEDFTDSDATDIGDVLE